MASLLMSPDEIRAQPDACFAYYGDRHDWKGAYIVHRDSELLDQSNFWVIKQEMEKIDPEEQDHAIERDGHWAVGWVETIRVRPGSPCEAKALELAKEIEDYPILDEDDWSQRESDEEDRWLEDEIRYLTRNHEGEVDKDEVYRIYEEHRDDRCDYDALQKALRELGVEVD